MKEVFYINNQFLKFYSFFQKRLFLLKVSSIRGASLIELLVVVSIMLFITGGTIKLLLPYTMQIQNLVHSQMSEGSLRELLSGLETQSCTETFSGKKIGQSIDQIKDEAGVPLFDRQSSDMFQRNLKVIKMQSSPLKSLCSSITANASGDCPSGCSDPGSFPGVCVGGSSNATKGYAEVEVYFSRPGSLFEKEDEALLCNSSDQRGCYKQSCRLRLSGTHTGVSGTTIGSCKVMGCLAGSGSGGGTGDCYTVEDAVGSPSSATLVGCGTTQDITQSKTTAYGFNAGHSGTGVNSTFIGYGAGKSSTGIDNTFLGYQAGFSNSTGNENTFLGAYVGYYNLSGEKNSFFGKGSGHRNRVGSHNTFLGYQAGNTNRVGNQNTFVGYQAGLVSTGNENTFLGHLAGSTNTTGIQNIFIGEETKADNDGNSNVVIGYKASGSKESTVIGFEAGGSDQGTAIGYQASGGVAIGYKASGGIAIGKEAQGGIAIGNKAKGGIAIGSQAEGGIAIGYNAKANGNNISIGNSAGKAKSMKCCNTIIGYQAGENTLGHGNTFLGNGAGQHNTGDSAPGVNAPGSFNTFIGHLAGNANTTGRKNVFLGYAAGTTNTTGGGNTIISSAISSVPLTGSGNTIVGWGTVVGSSSSNILIGATGTNILNENKKFYLGSGTNSWLSGDIDTYDIGITDGTTRRRFCLYGDNCLANSSRTLKKNIKIFTDYKKALEDILNTPLFNYRYKNEKIYHTKKRMGIISEELPAHLQVLKKDEVSQPDWSSIFGTFWASIKALHKKLMSFKTEFKSLIEKIKSQIENLKTELFKEIKNLKKDMAGLKTELTDTKTKLKNTERSLSSANTELTETKAELTEMKIEFKALKKKLKQLDQRVRNSQKTD